MEQIAYLLRYAYYSFRIAINDLVIVMAKIFIRIKVCVFCMWWMARFYAAWEEYSSTPVYRERLVCFGQAQAIYGFINSKWEQKYCLKLRFDKEPWLYWQVLFLPFSINVPDDLVIAAKDILIQK